MIARHGLAQRIDATFSAGRVARFRRAGMTRGLGAVLVVLAMTAAARGAFALDFSKVDCRAFLASGRGNMSAMIMFLRGYHAGKTNIVPFDDNEAYGGRLGFYCRQHPRANLLEASEAILTELDRGI
jgi:hypothetical protein